MPAQPAAARVSDVFKSSMTDVVNTSASHAVVADLDILVGDDEQLAATCADFLEVGLELIEQLVVRRDRDDRHVLIDVRERLAIA